MHVLAFGKAASKLCRADPLVISNVEVLAYHPF